MPPWHQAQQGFGQCCGTLPMCQALRADCETRLECTRGCIQPRPGQRAMRGTPALLEGMEQRCTRCWQPVMSMELARAPRPSTDQPLQAW
jgi:hypothetical protein